MRRKAEKNQLEIASNADRRCITVSPDPVARSGWVPKITPSKKTRSANGEAALGQSRSLDNPGGIGRYDESDDGIRHDARFSAHCSILLATGEWENKRLQRDSQLWERI